MNIQFCDQFLNKISVSANPDNEFITLNLVSNALIFKLTVYKKKKTLAEVSRRVVLYLNTKFLNVCFSKLTTYHYETES